jgi:hypothetical protein
MPAPNGHCLLGPEPFVSQITLGSAARPPSNIVIASEAKQSSFLEQRKLDCFVAFAPRNDEGTASGGELRTSDRQSLPVVSA